MKIHNGIKLTSIAAALAFSHVALSATHNDNDTMTGWQSSLAAEFSTLDTSGNGLVMPHEANKGKAFNKKTFAAADADNDGTLDQNEYIKYKTSMGATNQPGNSQPANSLNDAPESMSDAGDNTNMAKAAANQTVDQPEPTIETAEMSKDSAEPQKRSVGAVVDDSVITTKAKAAIFNTPNLKTLDIGVQTRQGEVALTGTVASEADKIKAEEVVRNVGGVSSVTNSLQVRN